MLHTKCVFYLMLPVIVVGCVGNLISLFVFSRKKMRRSAVVILLLALTCVDLSLLVLSVFTFIIPSFPVWKPFDEDWNVYMAYMLKSFYPVMMMVQTCSVCLMLAITVERWIAVCRPLQAHSVCTVSKSTKVVVWAVVGSVLYNFIRFFEFRIDGQGKQKSFALWLRDPNHMRWYYVGYYTILYNVTHFVVPFTLMSIANCRIVNVLVKRIRMSHLLTTQQLKEQKTTVMLLVVTSMFALCNLLIFVLNIIESIFPQMTTDPDRKPILDVLNDWANLFIVFNSASTFMIYATFSANYKRTLVSNWKKLFSTSRADEKAKKTSSVSVNSRKASAPPVCDASKPLLNRIHL